METQTTPESPTPKRAPRFRYVPLQTRSVAVRADAQDRKRSGLVPLCIGASRIMRGRDGTLRQYEARELRVEADRAQHDGRQLSVGLICFDCGRVYATEAEFKEDHQLTTAQYAKFAECHTWAYWCEDKADPKSMETVQALDAEIKALSKAHKESLSKVSNLADVDEMMRERKRAAEIEGMIKDAQARKRSEDENIVGILSETP